MNLIETIAAVIIVFLFVSGTLPLARSVCDTAAAIYDIRRTTATVRITADTFRETVAANGNLLEWQERILTLDSLEQMETTVYGENESSLILCASGTVRSIPFSVLGVRKK
ncbi:hypothetical protein [Treponema brennaborense]|uniref:Uncharacterized protein n=1 Tax=Treponema brennaborense (strain DSM 12168 / CIP 105900 / DD5/3) TaxID=906968 RepID=F4LMK0_TREBD|nr:hypothetical protein [Treponema brennaborense]AEE16747.1 hypothetical protein Trebr_1320 [Treponema brennaborense DSM 12168]